LESRHASLGLRHLQIVPHLLRARAFFQPTTLRLEALLGLRHLLSDGRHSLLIRRNPPGLKLRSFVLVAARGGCLHPTQNLHGGGELGLRCFDRPLIVQPDVGGGPRAVDVPPSLLDAKGLFGDVSARRRNIRERVGAARGAWERERGAERRLGSDRGGRSGRGWGIPHCGSWLKKCGFRRRWASGPGSVREDVDESNVLRYQ